MSNKQFRQQIGQNTDWFEVTREDFRYLNDLLAFAKANDEETFTFNYKNYDKAIVLDIPEAERLLEFYKTVYNLETPETPVRISIKL